jgi:hypothetical protein
MRACLVILSMTTLLTFGSPAQAKDITETLHWSIPRSQLGIARLRLGLGPKITRAACRYYWSTLKRGGSVRVNVIGAGGELLSAFHVTRDKCRT